LGRMTTELPENEMAPLQVEKFINEIIIYEAV
jgi:hypothetical protein